MVRPFTINVPPSEVAELRRRLHEARWPEGITDTGGIAKAEMMRLVRHWHNFIPGSYSPDPIDDISPDETRFLQRRSAWADQHGAYSHLQRTTPLTVAYALTDSPLGLAAWLLEKFILWSDPSSKISDEMLLTNLSVYWFTKTISSSMRYYLESAATPLRMAEQQRVLVPTHIAHFPYEMPFPPRSWVERGYSVTRWTTMSRGGHFAALEAPDMLAGDIIAAASPVKLPA